MGAPELECRSLARNNSGIIVTKLLLDEWMERWKKYVNDIAVKMMLNCRFVTSTVCPWELQEELEAPTTIFLSLNSD